MPAHRSGGPLTDHDLDRELAAALAVEPSVEFLARVRMRIAGEPEPTAWRLSRMFAAAGACAVAIAVALTAAQLDEAAPFAGAPLAVAASTPRQVQRPTPEMQAIMQSNADADRSLRMHKKEKNYVAIGEDAATYKRNFAYIAVFWANQKIDAAVDISTRGLTAARELEAAALVKDDGAVEKAMTALADTCGACHKEHREQLPDKTYAIRL